MQGIDQISSSGSTDSFELKNEKHLTIFKKLLGLTNTQDFKDAELAFYRKSTKFFLSSLDSESDEVLESQRKQHEELLTVKAATDKILRESFGITDEELIDFYLCYPDLHFIRKTQSYNKEDLLTIELIQKWLQFDKFQSFMVEFSQMNADDQDLSYSLVKEPAESPDNSSNLHLENQNVTDIDVSFENFQKLMGMGIDGKFGQGIEASENWTQRASYPNWSDGMRCLIHSRPMPGNSLELLRIEEAFKGIKCKDLQDYLTTPRHGNKINPSFKENYVIDQQVFNAAEDQENQIGEISASKGVSLLQSRYWRYTIPFMSDRDATLKIQLKHLDESIYGPGSFYILGASYTDEKIPEKDGAVRMYQYISGLCWQSEEKGEPIVNYIEISQIDFKGNFPSTIMNLVLGHLMNSEHRKMYEYMIKRRQRTDAGETSDQE